MKRLVHFVNCKVQSKHYELMMHLPFLGPVCHLYWTTASPAALRHHLSALVHAFRSPTLGDTRQMKPAGAEDAD